MSTPYTSITLDPLAEPQPGSPIPPRRPLVIDVTKADDLAAEVDAQITRWQSGSRSPENALIDYAYAVRQVKLAEVAMIGAGEYLAEALLISGLHYNMDSTQQAVESVRADLRKLCDALHRLDMAQPFFVDEAE